MKLGWRGVGVALVLGFLLAATLPWQVHQRAARTSGAFAAAPVTERVAPALLGGLRRVVGNFAWLAAYVSWERTDPVKTVAYMRQAVTAAPEVRFFWINGARMMAYDFPRWEARTAARPLSAVERARLAQPHYERALNWLYEAETALGPLPQLALERAMLHLHVARDKGAAAAAFREAWERPGGPFFAARLHGELLRDLDQPAAALAWYEALLPQLPINDPRARRAVVEARITDLRQQLGRVGDVGVQ